MTYLLDDLEAADLVARQPDPLDRRSRRIVATSHGRDVLADLETRFGHAEQRLLAGLAPDDRPVFRALLRDLAAHANALDPVATACDAITDLDRPRPRLSRRRTAAVFCYLRWRDTGRWRRGGIGVVGVADRFRALSPTPSTAPIGVAGVGDRSRLVSVA